MFIHHRTIGYILKRENINEADQVFLIYTKDFGKIKVSAKAVRRLNSKLRSSIQVFYLSEIEFIQGKALKTLTDAILIQRLDGIRKDLFKLRLAYNFSRVFNALVKNQEADEKLWQLLNAFFKNLESEKLTSIKAQLIYYFFFWNLLSVLGYAPELKLCVFCRKKVMPNRFFWIVGEGGLVCKNCLNKVKTRIGEIDIRTLKVLRLMMNNELDQDWQVLKRLKIDLSIIQNLKIISKRYFNYIYEKR